MAEQLLTAEMVDQFIRDGFVVVPNVFSAEEVQGMRDALHTSMADTGVHHGEMAPEQYNKLPKFGVQTQIFYPSWKLCVQVSRLTSQLPKLESSGHMYDRRKILDSLKLCPLCGRIHLPLE